jgi:PAS domain S-box-containing protein
MAMATDPLDIVAGTADAAVGTDEEGRVVIWNKAAERLLGYGAAEVLGKPCHDVLCGRDVHGNRFCDESCALQHMVRRGEAVHHFEMGVRRSSGQALMVAVSIVVVPGPKSGQHTILHLLQPLATDAGAAALIERIGVRGRPPVEPPLEAAGDSSQTLTSRETQVLRMLANGVGTEEIADSLFISATTVRNHVQNILRKLDVHSKLEAVTLAFRRRLI